jgi:hypothetical protein
MSTPETRTPDQSIRAKLPQWAVNAIQLYESNAANQFIIYGNVNDQLLIPSPSPHLGTVTDFLLQMLLPRFDVVSSRKGWRNFFGLASTQTRAEPAEST